MKRFVQAATSHVRKFCCVFSSLLLLSQPLLAAVNVNATRVVFDNGVQHKSLKLVNDGDQPMLVQSWIDDGAAHSTPDRANPAFVVLPPVLKLLPGEQREIRLMGSGVGLPTDRESLLWLNLYQIAPESPAASGAEKVRFALRTQLKVLWRPKTVPRLDLSSMNMLEFMRVSSDIYVVNKTKWNITLTDLVIEGYSSDGVVVAPGGKQAIFTLKSPVAINNKIDFAVINDDGNKWGLSASIK